jgi:hypothetical protein
VVVQANAHGPGVTLPLIVRAAGGEVAVESATIEEITGEHVGVGGIGEELSRTSN